MKKTFVAFPVAIALALSLAGCSKNVAHRGNGITYSLANSNGWMVSAKVG